MSTSLFNYDRDDIQRLYDGFAPSFKRMSRVCDVAFGAGHLRKNLLKQASGSVLDIACGTGENFVYYPLGIKLTAVDYSAGMLAEASKRAQHLKLDVDLCQMDAQQLEFPDNRFNTVVSTLSTCTIPDPIKALQEMARVCTPEGRILLFEHGRSRVGFIARWQDRRVHKHYKTTGCRWNQDPPSLVHEAGLSLHASRATLLGIFHVIEAAPR